jgi:hypothetical protein
MSKSQIFWSAIDKSMMTGSFRAYLSFKIDISILTGLLVFLLNFKLMNI